MKKLTSLAIALTMLLSLAACNSDGGTADADVTTAAEIEAVKDETTAPAETTEETTTTEPAPEASPAEDFVTEENDSGLTITNYKGKDTEVTIPAEIDGKPVTVIGYNDDKGAFANNGNITKVVIPEGVTEINAASFLNCKSLADIEFPESLTEISIYWYNWYNGDTKIPFDGTPWLEAKRAENPLVIVNNILIDGRTCSRSVEIPDGVKKICGGVFSGCTTITDVTIPNGVEKIDGAAFFGCERLTEIVLPDSVSYIGDFAFNNCIALENVTFPNNTVEMGTNIFGGSREAAAALRASWYKVEDVLPNTNFCPWLKNKILENPLVIVNGNLINGSMCTGDVVIPDSVKSIAARAFGGGEIDYDCGAYIESVKLPDGITKIPNELFAHCSSLKTITIPDSVTEIGDWAFRFTAITSINIPKGVTSIGTGAFVSTPLTSLTVPENVTEIGYNAFGGCGKLQSITLPNGLKKIGSVVFYNVPVTELTLPDSVESIAEDAFKGFNADITYKGEVYFPELYEELYAEINGQ